MYLFRFYIGHWAQSISMSIIYGSYSVVDPVHLQTARIGTTDAPTGSQPQPRSKIEISRRVTEKAFAVHTPSVVVVRVPFGDVPSRSTLKIPLHPDRGSLASGSVRVVSALSLSRHRGGRGGPWQPEQLRAGDFMPPWTAKRGPLMVCSIKDRRRAGGACGRGVFVQGGVGNPQVRLRCPGVFHTSGRVHGPLYAQGSRSSPEPWAT